MSIPVPPQSAKLVISLFLKDKNILSSVAKDLEKKFGQIDIISSWFPFDYTQYYQREMGAPLFKRVLAFKRLIRQSDLSKIKLATNACEQNYLKHGKRLVNIDPGYMIHARFVLATGKNYTHRIYIGKGIYADLTLIYTEGGFQKLPWTYPDYSDEKMLIFLTKVRQKYSLDLKSDDFVKKQKFQHKERR